jgi:hypothetical protein
MRDTSMGAAQYRKALGKLQFTHKQAGAAFGITERSSRRYASGAQAVSVAIANQVRAMLERTKGASRP